VLANAIKFTGARPTPAGETGLHLVRGETQEICVRQGENVNDKWQIIMGPEASCFFIGRAALLVLR
jgi:hypothetical protein